jgi:CobQ-like glutamine amidotransferase family enzyme
MTVEVLFQEVCGLYGDSQNAVYLQKSLPDAEFVFTELTQTPYFVENTPDIIYIGCMSESIQRRVIEKLLPLRSRLEELVNGGTVILATGNAGEIFAKKIEYKAEDITVEALNFFDLTVETDLFSRYNGKALGNVAGIDVVGFRSQFSFLYGDNSDCYFMECTRGRGINKDSKLEGMRKNNLMCTQLIGPLLPLNPLFCEYLIGLTGNEGVAACREAAMDAYTQRLKEFNDHAVAFDEHH